MPRRHVDCPDGIAFGNHVASAGDVITIAGAGVFLVTPVEARVVRRRGEANPGGECATTLEWTLSSPPPFHRFNQRPVAVADERR